MKKTLLAAAIAAVAFSGTSMAQESGSSGLADQLAKRMDSMPEVYGNIQLVVAYDDFESGSNLGHYDNGSTIGVKHSHQFTSGVEGFFVAELEFDADNKAGNGGLNAFDEAYVGVRGDSFGQVWVGSDDSAYERTIEVIENTWEYGAFYGLGIGSYSTGEGDLIQYMSPSFGGLKLHGAVQINGDGDGNSEKSFPYQLAVTYGMGPLELALAMDSNDGDTRYSSNDVETDVNGAASNENTYGVRATYEMNDLAVTAQYHTRSDFKDTAGIMAAYSMGANTFIAAYEKVEFDDAADSSADLFTVQALHNLSSNMYVYVEGYMGDGDDVFNDGTSDEQSTLAVGGTYYF